MQDRTLDPIKPARYGTVEEYFPGDPDTVQINMDDGGRMHTLATNVTVVDMAGVTTCLLCFLPAIGTLYLRGARHPAPLCRSHMHAEAHEILIRSAIRHSEGRAPVTQPLSVGDVLETPIGCVLVVKTHNNNAVSVRTCNGVTIVQSWEHLTKCQILL
jgi:hypothetical protein